MNKYALAAQAKKVGIDEGGDEGYQLGFAAGYDTAMQEIEAKKRENDERLRKLINRYRRDSC